MKQLVLDLLLPAAPSFADFVPGDNAEALFQLGQWMAREPHVRSLYLWGESGSGKSHLLASVMQQIRGGIFVNVLMDDLPGSIPADVSLVVDHVDALDEAGQIRLFDHYNTLREGGGFFLAAGSRPPMQLPLRIDLTTRLGWGLVYQIHALSEADKARALRLRASQLGFDLSDEMVVFLFTHAARSLPDLYRHLEAVNHLALSRKKPVTLGLLRAVVQQEQMAMDF